MPRGQPPGHNHPRHICSPAATRTVLFPGTSRAGCLFPAATRTGCLFPTATRTDCLFPGTSRTGCLFPTATRTEMGTTDATPAPDEQ